MKTSVAFIAFLLFIFQFNVNGQLYGHPLYSNNGEYKYFIGNSEPDSDWCKPGFDDSSWLKGTKTIGFGDGDDSTVISNTTSIYLRIHFKITNKANVPKANLLADFDDGYIAYLNGTEIVRVNLGVPGEHIPYNRLADRSHEAVYCRYYERPVTSYYIDDDLLANCLISGENILAIQVHNDSINGSDMTFNSTLFKYIPEEYNIWNDPFRFYTQVPLDSSRFPIVVINTDEFGLSVKKQRFNASMSVIHNQDKEYTRPSDSATDLDNNRISIEIRGNSTADVPKNSYNIEVQDSEGENLNASLLGMPADDDWILYAPFADKSLIRNELAFYLGRALGYYEPRTRFCELIYNGEYRGLYILTEKIKRNSNRVNISQNDFIAESGVEISGGYVFRFGDNDIYPKPDMLTNAQMAYKQNFFNDIFSIVNRHSLDNPETGFRKYIDEQYLIDYMLINELMHNVDAYGASTFMFKDRDDIDGKLKFGPIWDNDLSLGNTNYRNLPNDWMFSQNECPIQMTHILSDTIFVRNLSVRWFELRKTVFSDANLAHFVDSASNAITESRILNYKVWPLLDAPLLWPSYIPSTYEFEIDTMKQWMAMHNAWIDNNIRKIHYNLPPVSIDEHEISYVRQNFLVYPNPVRDVLTIDFTDKSDMKLKTVELYNLYGIVGKFYTYTGNLKIDFSNYSRGIYFIKIDGLIKKIIY